MRYLIRSLKSIRGILLNGSRSYLLLLAFIGLNVPLILLILVRHIGVSDLTWLSWLYISNLALGYYGLPLLVVVSLIFLILTPVRRASLIGSGIVVALFVYYLSLDSFVYDIFKFHIDPFWIEFALKDSASLGVTHSTLMVVIAMLLGVAAVETVILALASRFVALKGLVRLLPLFVVLAFAVSQVLHIVTYERNDHRITSLTPCLPAYRPVTSHREAIRYGGYLPLGDYDPSNDGGGRDGASMLYPLGELRFDAPAVGLDTPNIVVLLLESWRFDACDTKTAPNIHEFGQTSSVFANHLSSGNQTTCGIFGLFYGLHPTYWTAVKANSESIDNPVLIDVLKERGYSFGIFARSNFERHKIKDTIFNGIDVHEDFSGKTIPLEDIDMTDRIIRFVEEKSHEGTPFMALAFYKSSHAPYEYPSEHAIFDDTKNVGISLTKDTDPTPYMNDYWNSIHFVDELVGRILGRLETLGLMDRTVVVITTDHGESFNEQQSNYWGHGSNFTQNQVRVPFIIHAPGRSPELIERRTSHIDLVPTLLQDYFGCANDASDYCNGRNLFDESPVQRPLVVGSYVSHAYILGDDVFEIKLAHTKKYRLDDIRKEVSFPHAEFLEKLMSDITRFYDNDGSLE